MNNLVKAKSLLVGDKTCALVKENLVYTSTKKGISPMLDFINQGVNLNGFSVADRIVGKAAAMLFCYAGIEEVHAVVLSQSGLNFLTSKGIKVTYDKLVDNIINRTNTGLCPMEQTVKDIDDLELALEALKNKVAQLRSQAN